MSARMSQGCAMVLLLAMMLAMAAGLIAWGPILIAPADHLFAGAGSAASMAHAANAWASLPLAAVSVWGLGAVSSRAWPEPLRRPWLGFFALCLLMSLTATAYHLNPGDTGYAVSHSLAAAALTALALAFMAERVDMLFGSVMAFVAGCVVVACAALWWFVGQWATGQGDLRAILFVQYLPLLLVPAGALALPGRHTGAGDWLLMLGLYLVSRIAGWTDDAVLSVTGWLSGHTLMHLLWAAVAALPAYRAAVAPAARRSLVSSLAERTQRTTSLNTSS